MAGQFEIRETVRQHYAAEAVRFGARTPASSCCGTGSADKVEVTFGGSLYGTEACGIPEAALGASAGCGVPTAVADLHPGDVVLDLGSGAGLDVLIAARRVAPGGRAIGLDMTAEMLELARKNAAEAGLDNAEFVEGYLEDIPLAAASVDVVLSNCVINLAADKGAVLREAARVLRPGGRFAVTDIVAGAGMDEPTRTDREKWAGCLAGALTEAEYRAALLDAGFAEVEVIETHRSDDRAFAAIVRARKPS
ncbi:MAG TPA: arsenite methyltransferase [Candidatus Binatia bacterium]|nr:arsenite methyltransferase [Candidatus Binatia bacterium]